METGKDNLEDRNGAKHKLEVDSHFVRRDRFGFLDTGDPTMSRWHWVAIGESAVGVCEGGQNCKYFQEGKPTSRRFGVWVSPDGRRWKACTLRCAKNMSRSNKLVRRTLKR